MFRNVKVYGLQESLIRSGLPMRTDDPSPAFVSKTANVDDMKRGDKLAGAPSGSGHDNFLKGIIVQFDFKYPEYFSPQLQRYHWIDIVSSQSKMHRITSRELTRSDFTESVDGFIIDHINKLIEAYNLSEDKVWKEKLFKKIISNLPSGYTKWMAISTNYLQLKTIYNQRRFHKLSEWREFCSWIEHLPSSYLIIGKSAYERIHNK